MNNHAMNESNKHQNQDNEDVLRLEKTIECMMMTTTTNHGDDTDDDDTPPTPPTNVLCDARHNHSFRNVVSLSIFATHYCCFCDQTIHNTYSFRSTVGVLFGSRPSSIVQCAACDLYAHRACAFSGAVELWQHNKCTVNNNNNNNNNNNSSSNSSSSSNNKDVSNIIIATKNDKEEGEINSNNNNKSNNRAPNHQEEKINDNDNDNDEHANEFNDKIGNPPLTVSNLTFKDISQILQENIISSFTNSSSSSSRYKRLPTEEEVDEENGNVKSDDNTTAISIVKNSGIDIGIDLDGRKKSNNDDDGGTTFPTIAGSMIVGGVVGFGIASCPVVGGLIGVVSFAAGKHLKDTRRISDANDHDTNNSNSNSNYPHRFLYLGRNRTRSASDIEQQQQRRRRELLMVRPQIQIPEPIWDEIYQKARRDYTEMITKEDQQHQPISIAGLFDLFHSTTNTNTNISTTDIPCITNHERYERDIDIIETDEDEIALTDKVLLLVSRILNNKDSLPGHIYRTLINAFQRRSLLEEEEEANIANSGMTASIGNINNDNNKDGPHRSRRRRQDCHAVIKYVTATLLETRPSFGSTSFMTELTAASVESLVFGHGDLYDTIMKEVQAEYKVQDDDLTSKIINFKNEQRQKKQQQQQQQLGRDGSTTAKVAMARSTISTSININFTDDDDDDDDDNDNDNGDCNCNGNNDDDDDDDNDNDNDINTSTLFVDTSCISQEALDALHYLPQAHSAVEKLRYCVIFIQQISSQYTQRMISTTNMEDNSKNKSKTKTAEPAVVGADSLLKMVCQHILVSNIHDLGINSQIAFLEEFARDEQLLRGREGYALVTLQASLHFLNCSSTDFSLFL